MKTKKSTILPRGYSTVAENLAENFRKELSIHPCGHLCGFKLANHLGVSVCTASDYGFDPTVLVGLTGWSGLYLVNSFGEKIIIYNSGEPFGRQQSTIMHELAHVILGHTFRSDAILAELPFLRSYDPLHESEAGYLGASLQITRKGLVWAVKKSMSVEQMAEYYNATTEMVSYRLRISGVAKQFGIRV